MVAMGPNRIIAQIPTPVAGQTGEADLFIVASRKPNFAEKK
jgi:hypothetical protein